MVQKCSALSQCMRQQGLGRRPFQLWIPATLGCANLMQWEAFQVACCCWGICRGIIKSFKHFALLSILKFHLMGLFSKKCHPCMHAIICLVCCRSGCHLISGGTTEGAGLGCRNRGSSVLGTPQDIQAIHMGFCGISTSYIWMTWIL